MSRIILLITLFIFGCASQKPIEPNQVVDFDVPEQWEINISQNLDFDQKWWSIFNDDNLNSFVVEFMDENISLEKAMLNTRKAKQASVIATGSLLPSISLSSGVVESEQNTAGIPTVFSALLGQSSDEVTVFTQENYNLSLGTQWEIDLWGKLRQGRIATKQQYLSAKYFEDFLKLSLTAEASKLYFAIIEAEQVLNNASKKLKNAETIFELYSLRYNKGSISIQAYQQSKIIFNATKSDYNNKLLMVNTLKREARLLVKDYPSTEFLVNNNFPKKLPSIPNTLPADIVKRRPDLIAQQYNLLANKALDRQALLTLFPTFSLSGSYGSSSNDLEDLTNEDFSVWNKGLNVFMPVFNAGKLIANKRLAKSNREIAMLDFVNALLTAYKEIESGFESDLTSNQALEIINENIVLSENIYNTTFDGFMKGSSSFEDTINANNALYDNLDLKARLEKVRIEQRINLILALGGGFNITND
ncbi:TolC family protein [Candidatus Marinimicrobia bacterium]|nr:TolC family protein [Candidatus Neomarinimicrobiota bacterium]